VFDSGRSIKALIAQLKLTMRNNYPQDVRIACPWYKPSNKQVEITPDYFVYESSEWLVFPHELSGLTSEEIAENKSDLANVKELF
jgi:hypoxanthine-guanine phosphoribosyltransferase